MQLQEKTDLKPLVERISRKEPDLVEFRIDSLHTPGPLSGVARAGSYQTIATDRSQKTPSEMKKLLIDATEAGFDYVDVDLKHPFIDEIVRHAKTTKVGVIISHHDLTETPAETSLLKLTQTQQAAGSDICKIVTTANDPHDNLTILNFIKQVASTTKIVSFAMGKLGVPSRVLSPSFGAEFTFAAFDSESTTASGQLSIDDLRKAWQLLEIT